MLKLKIDRAYINSVKWGGYSIGIGFIRQILLVPAFILTVGSSNYAFWIVLSSIVLMIRALNLGQLHYSSNLINLGYHKNGTIAHELAVAQGANYIYITFQLLLGLIVSSPVVLAAVSNFSVGYILQNYGPYSLILLVISKIAFQYNNLFLLRIFEPLGKIKKTIKYQTIGELLDFVATVLTIYFTHSIFLTSCAIFTSNILFCLFSFFYIKKNIPFTIPFSKGIDLFASFRLIKKSFLLTTSFLVEKVYENGLNILIANVFITSRLPIFTTNRVISNSFYRVSNAAVIPLMPNIQKQFSLSNPKYIISKMIDFWKISSFFTIMGTTLFLPVIPYIYTKWTGNRLTFSVSMVCYLIMAVSFQNFGMVINEFLKKTNLSKQILTYNIFKAVVTVVFILIFSYIRYFQGLGIALLAGESISLLYMLITLKSIFNDALNMKVIYRLLVPVLLFCASLLVYIFVRNYLLFIGVNFFILISYIFLMPIFNRLKRHS